MYPQFPVLATRAGGYGDEDEGGGGRTELASLLERGKVMRLRAALDDETRRSMTYSEFQSLCEDCGMDEADAQQVGDRAVEGRWWRRWCRMMSILKCAQLHNKLLGTLTI